MTRLPTSTYRLQLSGHLKLGDAAALVEYFSALGISDLYLSPLFRAVQESRHGYDVIDHNTIDPELGDEADLRALALALAERDMGLILDVVPNHMGIDDSNNIWWQDVLEHGRHSPFARFFDIDWSPPKELLQGRVLLPVLGDQYGNVLERGELRLEYEAQKLVVRHFERTFPVAVRTWTPLLREMLDGRLTLPTDDPSRMELESIVSAISHLPSRDEVDGEQVRAGLREEDVARRRLATLVEGSGDVSAALSETISTFNGRPGDPASFDRLEALLAEQVYRLCFWQVAADEINYRRFFDVNELAALRVEDPQVFQAAHALVFRCVAQGWVTGLRIDHPDGLLDPEQYFSDVQDGFRALAHDGSPQSPLFIVAEKILKPDEELPRTWPVQGTTGYDFLNDVNGLFVNRRHAARVKDIYTAFSGVEPRFAEIGYHSKRDVLAHNMSSELHMLAGRLDRISEQHRSSRDFTLASLRTVLAEVIACFPVYRSYVRPGVRPVGDEDRRVILAAIRAAGRRNPGISTSLFAFVASLLLLEDPPGLTEPRLAERRDFVLRFQQLTGPVTAKGLEDTALYRAFPLASLNEVGGNPGEFGVSLEQFHRRMASRAERWPNSFLATTTHDTKRSEDVRARINVLSEIPDAWEQALHRWRSLNRRHKTQIEGAEAPHANEEHLFYQTLVGTWPGERPGPDVDQRYIERIAAYLLKAVREAKLHTSWGHPHEDYETAVVRFVREALSPKDDNAFVHELGAFHRLVALPACSNALGQTVLKIAAPGVADFYQGTELWDDSLVDPDNRRPVDFHLRRRTLSELQERGETDPLGLARELVQEWTDGRIKHYVIWKGLQFRRRHSLLFQEGACLPLAANGPRADHIVALARSHRHDWVVAVCPRWTTSLLKPDSLLVAPSAWEGTRLELPVNSPRRWQNLYTGETAEIQVPISGPAPVPVADLLRRFPVALWHGSLPRDESKPASVRRSLV